MGTLSVYCNFSYFTSHQTYKKKLNKTIDFMEESIVVTDCVISKEQNETTINTFGHLEVAPEKKNIIEKRYSYW